MNAPRWHRRREPCGEHHGPSPRVRPPTQVSSTSTWFLGCPPILSGWPHHARAELVENLKGRLVARKTKLPLKLHGGHAGRLTGDQISGPEPDVQAECGYAPSLFPPSARCSGGTCGSAGRQGGFQVERLSRRAAVRAGKAVSPAGFLQVGGAGRIIGEKSLELG